MKDQRANPADPADAEASEAIPVNNNSDSIPVNRKRGRPRIAPTEVVAIRLPIADARELRSMMLRAELATGLKITGGQLLISAMRDFIARPERTVKS